MDSLGSLGYDGKSENIALVDSIEQTKIRKYIEKVQKGRNVSLKEILSMNRTNFDLITKSIDLIKQVFLLYSRKGDKLNFNQMSFSSFLNFYREMVFPAKNTERELELEGSDLLLVFISLTGFKNYYTKEKLKTLFDKNYGFVTPLGEIYNKKTYLDGSNILKNKTNNIALKLDFNLFVKSFEFVSARMYPYQEREQALRVFIERDLQLIREEEDRILAERREIEEKLSEISELNSFSLSLKRVLKDYYGLYATSSNQISFDQFFESIYKQILQGFQYFSRCSQFSAA